MRLLYMAYYIYGHTIVLRAQFVAGGHSDGDIRIKQFYDPSYNKTILYEFFIISPNAYWY